MVSADQRRAAKAINFGIVYGMGQLRLARELSIPRAEAKEYLERFAADMKESRVAGCGS